MVFKKTTWISFVFTFGCVFGQTTEDHLSLNLTQLQDTQAATERKPLMASSHQRFENLPFIEIDVLAWTINQQGNTFAATGYAPIVPTSGGTYINVTPGQVYSPPSSIQPGIRAIMGCNFAYDFWDFAIGYTWLQTKQTQSITSNITDSTTTNTFGGLMPLFNYDPTNSSLGGITINGGSTYFLYNTSILWQFYFGAVDAEIGKNIFMTPAFSLRLFWGLKGSWQRQKMHVVYNVSNLSTKARNAGLNVVDFKEYFWGIGPRIGVHSNWQCVKHFSLFADYALSALWSRFNTNGQSTDTINNTYSNVLIADQDFAMHKLTPVIEMTVGLSTDWVFRMGNRLVVTAGWETQMWFFMNQHSSSISDLSLSLEGLTVQFRYDF